MERYLGDRVDYITVRGLAKVLADEGSFEPPETVIDPEALRERLFASGPTFEQADLFHPQTRAERIAAAAVELDVAPAAGGGRALRRPAWRAGCHRQRARLDTGGAAHALQPGAAPGRAVLVET